MSSVRVRSGRRLAAGLILLLALGCAYQFTSTSSNSQGENEVPYEGPVKIVDGPESVAVISGVEARQLSAFSLLRSHPEGLPSSLLKTLRHPILGENFALAQQLPIRLRRRFWLVPGRENICIVNRNVGKTTETTCTNTAEALRHGLTTTTLAQPLHSHAPAPRVIVGVAPNNQDEVQIRTGRTIVRAKIEHNVFVVRDESRNPPDEFRFR
jgi:hypothetical protein